MIFHILSSDGDMMEMLEVANGESIDSVKAKLDALENDENVIFMTDFYYELTSEGSTLLIYLSFPKI